MRKIDIYVQSRGLSQDYYWLKCYEKDGNSYNDQDDSSYSRRS